MRLSIWTLYQWMDDLGMEPADCVVSGAPCLHGNRLQDDASWDTVRISEAQEPGYLTQMVNGVDRVLFPRHTPMEVLDASSQAYEFFGSWECDLLQCIARREPLQKLVDTAFRVFARPILIQRPQSGRMMANTRGYDGCDDAFWALYDQRQTDLSAAMRSASSDQGREPQERRPGVSGVAYSPWYQDDVLEKSIFQGARNVLTITLVRAGQPFRPGEQYLLDSFAQWIKEYITHTAHSPFAGTETAAPLIQLLEQERIPPEQAARFYRSFRWSQDDVLQAYCCRPEEDQTLAPVLRDVLEEQLPESCVFLHNGTIAVLVNVTRSSPPAKGQTHLSGMTVETQLRCGSSLLFKGVERFPLFFRQAEYALGHAFTARLLHASIDNLVPQCLSRRLKQDPWILSLVRPELLQLRTYDQEHGAGYVEILKSYLLHGGNCTDTARSLGIPRNTLLYRMGRIQTMLPGDLDQLEYRKQLLVSCLLL